MTERSSLHIERRKPLAGEQDALHPIAALWYGNLPCQSMLPTERAGPSPMQMPCQPEQLPAAASEKAGGNGLFYLPAQLHCGPHWHCGPQAQPAFGAACAPTGFWQPQMHCAPGQAVQLHWDCVVVFMVFLLSM